MTLQALPFPIFWPRQHIRPLNGASVAFPEIDANGEQAGWVVKAPFTGNIAKIGFRWGTITSGDTITLGIYQVDGSSGPPPAVGALWDTSTSASVTPVTSTDNNKFVWVTLDAVAAVTKGQDLYIIWTNSATPGDIQLSGITTANSLQFPIPMEGGAGSATSPAPMLCFMDDGGDVYVPYGSFPAGDASATATPTQVSISSSTTPDHMGLKFQVPFAARLSGFQWSMTDPDGDGAWYLVAADWDGTPGAALASFTYDKEIRCQAGDGVAFVQFATPVELTINTWYRLVFVPSTTTSSGLDYWPLADADVLAGWFGSIFVLTTAKDPTQDSDWTDYDNVSDGFRVPDMTLIFDQLSDDAGGAAAASDVGGWQMPETQVG